MGTACLHQCQRTAATGSEGLPRWGFSGHLVPFPAQTLPSPISRPHCITDSDCKSPLRIRLVLGGLKGQTKRRRSQPPIRSHPPGSRCLPPAPSPGACCSLILLALGFSICPFTPTPIDPWQWVSGP